MKKPALFTTVVLALCAADARAQTVNAQFDEIMATSDLARRVGHLAGQPGQDLQGQGHWVNGTAVQKGRIEAVIDGPEGEPQWRLDALTTEYLPGVGLSQRFVYGGVYGTLYAFDGTEAAPILVQGEWARHGQGSPFGSLVALVFRPAPFPQGSEILGTLTGDIEFFEDASGADGGPSIVITGARSLSGMSASSAASGMQMEIAPGLARSQAGNGSVAGVRVLGFLGSAQRSPAIGAFAGLDAVPARPMNPAGATGGSVGVALQSQHMGQLAQASATAAPSSAGSASRLDRVGTCGTQDGALPGSTSGHVQSGHQDVGLDSVGAITYDGLVRVVYHMFD